MFHLKSYFGSSIEAEARVTLGSPPPCSGREMGQLWFNGLRKDLHICDGLMWTTLLQSENHAEDSFSQHRFNSHFDSFSGFFYTFPGYSKHRQSQSLSSRKNMTLLFECCSKTMPFMSSRYWSHFTNSTFIYTANQAAVAVDIHINQSHYWSHNSHTGSIC